MRRFTLLLPFLLFAFTSLGVAGEGEWTPIGPGIGVGSFTMDSSGTIIYTLASLRIFKTADGGESWTELSDRLPSDVCELYSIAMLPSNPEVVYVGGWGLVPGNPNDAQATIYKTVDGGSTWVYAGNGLPTGIYCGRVRAIAIDPLHPDTLYAGIPAYGGLYKSTDGGLNWYPKLNGFLCPTVTSIVIDPTNPEIVYLGCSGDDPCPGGKVFKSTNGGEKWAEADSGFPPGEEPSQDDTTRVDVGPLVINPVNPEILYAGVWLVTGEESPSTLWKVWSTVYKTTDGARSWAKADSGLPSIGVPLALAIDPIHSDTVYLGSFLVAPEKSIYRSANGGQSWEEFSNGLPDGAWVADLQVTFTKPTRVFAALEDGLWSYTYPDGIDDDHFPGSLPTQISLLQNYPNPFNSTTAISYQLLAVSPHHTTLKIYNILGQKIRTLVDEEQRASNYRVLWDGRDDGGKPVASGVYLAKLQVIGDRLKVEKTRRMVLIR